MNHQYSKIIWSLYFKNIRGNILFFLFGLFLSYGYHYLRSVKEDIHFIFWYLPILFFITLFLLIYNWYKIKPLKKIFGKLNSSYDELSHVEKIKNFNISSEWPLIESILDQILRKAQDQSRLIEVVTQEQKILIESIPSPILILDKTLKIKMSNNALKENFLTKSLSTSQSFSNSLYSIFQTEIVQLFEEVISNSQTKTYENFCYNNKYYNLFISPLFSLDKELIGSIALFQDISNAIRLDKMRRDFVANVSHEMKTPLTTIKGFAQHLFLNRPENYKFNNELDIINRNADKLNKILSDLLKLSKLEEEEEKLEVENLDFKNILFDLYESIKIKYPHIESQLVTNLKVNSFLMNSLHLEQILSNLIDNSFKYANSRNPILKIEVNTELLSSKKVCLTFQDNGIGISPENKERVFERFFRVKKINQEGAGLGLAIVKNILKKYHGSISISYSYEDDQSSGTQFYLELEVLC